MVTNQDNELPKGFKMTELGLLPGDWKAVKLASYLEEKKEKNKANRRLTVYTVSNVYGFILSDDFFDKPVYSRELKTYKIVSKGDFAYNPYRVNVGSLGLFLHNEIGLVSPAYVVFRVRSSELDNRYLYALLKSDAYIEQIRRVSMSRGSVRRSLSYRDLVQFTIPLPPLPEQKAIAQVLSNIQRAIEVQDKVIAAVRELKKSLMHHLFTYGPVPFSKAERVPLKETEIGPVPEHWEVVKLGEVVHKKDGIKRGPWGGSIKKEIFVPVGYKVYEQKNVIANDFSIGDYFIDDNKFRELEDFEVRSGDILITAAGTLGKIAIVPEDTDKGIINQALLRLRVNEGVISKLYFQNAFNRIVDYKLLEGMSHGATLKNLSSVAVLRNIPIPLPLQAEQQEIIKILSATDRKIESEENHKIALQTLFKTMLHLLMTGRVRVKGLEDQIA